MLLKKFGFGIALVVSILTLFCLGSGVAQMENSGAARAADTAPLMDWHITGPIGGDVRALTVDPSDPAKFYFGTLDGQIYASTDAGQSWHLFSNFNRPNLIIDHIIVDPRDSNVIYAGGHRHKESGALFKTKNGGVTWTDAKDLKGEAIHSLAQSPNNLNQLLAGTNSGVYRSLDSGETWSKFDTASVPGLINVESIAVDPRDANIIYAGTWYLPYKSGDGGKSWAVTKQGIIDDSDIFAIDIDPRDPDHVVASACSGIYESHNSGATWSKFQGIPSQSRRTRAILQHPTIAGVIFAGTTEGFWRTENGGASWMLTTSKQLEINSIAVHPKNPLMIYIGTNNFGVMISRDGGKSFNPSNDGYSGRFTKLLVADRERAGRVYAATINTATGGGFFFVSNDSGDKWEPSMRNMPARLIVQSILQDQANGDIIYLGTNLGLYKSIDRGQSWAPFVPAKQVSSKKRSAGAKSASAKAGKTEQAGVSEVAAVTTVTDDSMKLAQQALKDGGYDIGVADGKAGSRTVEAIRKFQKDKSLLPSGRLDDATMVALGLKPGASTQVHVSALNSTYPINMLTFGPAAAGKPTFLAATNSGLFKSADLAKGWDRISYGPDFDARTTYVAITGDAADTIFVGTAKSGVLVSRDGGASWNKAPGVPVVTPINVIVVDPKRPGFVYVGTGQTLFSSRDGGVTWLRRGVNLPIGEFYSIAINPNNTDEVYVGSSFDRDGGLFRSVDAGDSWRRIDPRDAGIAVVPSQRVWSIAFDRQHPNRLLVGTHSAGIFALDRRPDPVAKVTPQ